MGEFLQYRHTSIIDGSTISFGPMRVKHQMALVEMEDTITSGDVSGESFTELLKSIIFGLIDRTGSNLYMIDYEMLLFKIRSKSYGNEIKFRKIYGTEEYNLIFDTDKDVNIIGEENKSSITVPLCDGRSVVITPPTVAEADAAEKEANGKFRLKDLITLRLSVKKIIDDESNVTDLNKEAAKSLFETIEIKDLELIKKEFSKFPILSAMKEYSFGENKFTVNAGDFSSNFFVL